MLAKENLPLVLSLIGPDDVVLDVGGASEPLRRADHVIDLLPYGERRADRSLDDGPERFSERTWTARDICSIEPFPYEDKSIDFAFCSHTLEDVRDPILVCSELCRVAKRGYIEVPSRLAETCTGMERGRWPGWYHHRWLIELEGDELVFLHKSPAMAADPSLRIHKHRKAQVLKPALDTLAFVWTGSFRFRERIIIERQQYMDELRSFVARHAQQELFLPGRSLLRRRLAHPRPPEPTARLLGATAPVAVMSA